MTADEPYRLRVAPSAARAIRDRLPEAVAAAVVEFVTGPLLDDPHRVGKPLRHGLEGLWSARRGIYRVIYEVDDVTRTVTVLDAAHRADAYHRR